MQFAMRTAAGATTLLETGRSKSTAGISKVKSSADNTLRALTELALEENGQIPLLVSQCEKRMVADIDGTLVESVGDTASRLHRAAFAHCLKEVFDLDADIDAVKHQGSTDPLIIMDILDTFGLDPQQGLKRMPELVRLMVNYFEENVDEAGSGLRVLPGAINLLENLKERGDVATCLVSGNLEDIGWGKMHALGIKRLFTVPNFGGFGSDYCGGTSAHSASAPDPLLAGNYKESWRDRSELLRIAGSKARAIVGDTITRAFHVGDAPTDMRAAREAQVVGIGVATGVYPKEVLIEAGADAVLDSLENLDEVLSAMGLDGAEG